MTVRLGSAAATLLAAAAVVASTSGGAAAAPAAGTGAKIVHLTFDDGPDPRWTPKVLDLLRRYDAHATFFVVGTAVESNPALARRIVRDGHLLGNHTYSHVALPTLPSSRFLLELDATAAAIRRITHTTPRWLRPPYGAIDARTRALAGSRGYRVALWDVDPQDWRRPGSAAIAAHVVSRARPGGTVLLHDGGGDRSQTLAALGEILATLSARGYSFRPLGAS